MAMQRLSRRHRRLLWCKGGVESTRMAQTRLTVGAKIYDWNLTHIFATSLF